HREGSAYRKAGAAVQMTCRIINPGPQKPRIVQTFRMHQFQAAIEQHSTKSEPALRGIDSKGAEALSDVIVTAIDAETHDLAAVRCHQYPIARHASQQRLSYRAGPVSREHPRVEFEHAGNLTV